MPRLPTLSGSQVVRVLEHLGFAAVRQRGSHVVLRKGVVGTVLPLHREPKTGTLAGIIRQAGLTNEAFMDVASGL